MSECVGRHGIASFSGSSRQPDTGRAGLSATPASPVISMTSSTRPLPMRWVAAIVRRWDRALRPGWTALASSRAPTSCSGAPVPPVGLAVDRHRAGRRAVEAHDHAHRGRLADAVRAEYVGHRTGGDGEADGVDGGLVAVALGQLAHFDHEAPPRWVELSVWSWWGADGAAIRRATLPFLWPWSSWPWATTTSARS